MLKCIVLPQCVVCLYSLEQFPMLVAPFLRDRSIMDCGYCAKSRYVDTTFIRLLLAVLNYDFLL